jgi:hypothetical protein
VADGRADQIFRADGGMQNARDDVVGHGSGFERRNARAE